MNYESQQWKVYPNTQELWVYIALAVTKSAEGKFVLTGSGHASEHDTWEQALETAKAVVEGR